VIALAFVVIVIGVAYSGCVDSRDAHVRAGLTHCRDAFRSRTSVFIDPNGNVTNVRELLAAVRERDACENGVEAAAQRSSGSSATAQPLHVEVVDSAEPPAPSVPPQPSVPPAPSVQPNVSAAPRPGGAPGPDASMTSLSTSTIGFSTQPKVRP
jgi:hypothetical protein